MKRIFFFSALLASVAFTACNNDGTTTSTSTDSSTITQTTEATGMDTMNMNNNSAGMSGGGTLMEVNDKTMQKMKSMQMSGDPDVDFASMMMEHHKAAIEMSNIELLKGEHAPFKEQARKIIDDSNKDNAQFQQFLSNNKPSGKSDFGQKAMQMMTMPMNMDMSEKDADMQYANMMTMHHQMGISMANDYVKAGKNEELKKIARNMIDMQKKDIEKFNELKKGH